MTQENQEIEIVGPTFLNPIFLKQQSGCITQEWVDVKKMKKRTKRTDLAITVAMPNCHASTIVSHRISQRFHNFYRNAGFAVTTKPGIADSQLFSLSFCIFGGAVVAGMVSAL